jgi:hypothetical protein
MLACVVMLSAIPASAAAQTAAQPRPAAAVEFTAGYAGFVDDAMIDHGVFGGALRVHLSPRVSVGPELVYMAGPDGDSDLFLTGNLTFDVIAPRPSSRVTPFLVIGGGVMRHTHRIGPLSFSSSEGAVTGGAGVRAWVGERVYLASEFRIGWELHYRLTGSVGVTLGR